MLLWTPYPSSITFTAVGKQYGTTRRISFQSAILSISGALSTMMSGPPTRSATAAAVCSISELPVPQISAQCGSRSPFGSFVSPLAALYSWSHATLPNRKQVPGSWSPSRGPGFVSRNGVGVPARTVHTYKAAGEQEGCSVPHFCAHF